MSAQASIAQLLAAQVPAEVPATPDAQEAREAAEVELSHPIYFSDEGLATRIRQWLAQFLPGETWDHPIPQFLALFFIVLVIAAGVVALMSIPRKSALASKRTAGKMPLFNSRRDAAELTQAADAAAAQGDYDAAILQRFRAIIRSLEKSGVIEGYPGMTAMEAVTLSAQVLGPTEFISRLGQAAELFYAVCYGKVAATAAQDDWMRALSLDLPQDLPQDQPGSAAALHTPNSTVGALA